MVDKLLADIQEIADPKKAENNTWFFKTKEGEYGHGDQFIGLTVPQCRAIAKTYKDLSLDETQTLLASSIHEERLIALLILVGQFQKATSQLQKQIYDFYLANTVHINNWDLVDTSADKIVGAYLFDKNWDILKQLAKSDLVWERRIAMIATYYFIRQGQYEVAFTIADMLLQDKHDLIHKAVGWMLREAGKRSGHDTLKSYLQTRYKTMPRTTLRYAIEHFDEATRKAYLQGII